MRKLFLLLAVTAVVTASAQTTVVPEGFTSGHIINTGNEKMEGAIKEFFKKGSIQFTGVNGSKKSYTPADINQFTIGNDVYVAYMNDFYKETVAGKKGSLLQKVTNNAGKMLYNGTEAYAASTTEGKPGDFYIRIKSTGQVERVTAANFEKVFTSNCSDCTTLVKEIQAKQLDYSSIEKAVQQYNVCE